MKEKTKEVILHAHDVELDLTQTSVRMKGAPTPQPTPQPVHHAPHNHYMLRPGDVPDADGHRKRGAAGRVGGAGAAAFAPLVVSNITYREAPQFAVLEVPALADYFDKGVKFFTLATVFTRYDALRCAASSAAASLTLFHWRAFIVACCATT